MFVTSEEAHQQQSSRGSLDQERIIPTELPDSELVRAHLNVLLTHPLFANSEPQREFLRWIVDKALQGKSREINEKQLLAVLKASNSTHGEVRGAAREIRRKLAHFEKTDEGKQALVRFDLPVGSYIPTFELTKGQLPKLSLRSSYQILPASREDIIWAAELAKQVYKGLDVIHLDVMLEWYDSNPNGFSIVWAGGERIGNLDILPLKASTIEDFRNGKICEPEFVGGNRPYTTNEEENIRDLYIESFVCPEHSFAVAAVLCQFEELVDRICDPEQIQRVLAIAASAGGQDLLKDLGMQIKGNAQDHDLFVGTYADVSSRLEDVVDNLQQLLLKRKTRRTREQRPVAL